MNKRKKRYLILVRVMKQNRMKSHGIVLNIEARSVGSACLKAYDEARRKINTKNKDLNYSFEIVMVVESSSKKVLGLMQQVIEEFVKKGSNGKYVLSYGAKV